MRYLFVLLLTGCTYNVTLHQRGGGEQLRGVFNLEQKELTLTVDGDRYRTGAVRGRSDSLAFGFVPGSPVAIAGGSSTSNQYSVVLQTGRGILRCGFAVDGAYGNGVCVDDKERTYDMVLRRGS